MRRAMDGGRLAELLMLAVPILRQAEQRCVREGPGRRPDYSDWQISALIAVAVAKRRKTKSAQYRFLVEHRLQLMDVLGLESFPARSTYFERYHDAWRLFQHAIAIQGDLLTRRWADPCTVAVDKSLVFALGPPWHKRERRFDRARPGVDRGADWGFSEHHGWVYGYSFEVVVTAPAHGPVVPLQASVGPASASEHRTFGDKIPRLPRRTRHVLADRAYDNNRYGESIEYSEGRPTGRHFVCIARRPARTPRGPCSTDRHRIRRVLKAHRAKRQIFCHSRTGQRLRRRRGRTVEPFMDWFKGRFELHDRAWHRGLSNNATQILGAMFVYQLLLRYNRRTGAKNTQIQWILDAL